MYFSLNSKLIPVKDGISVTNRAFSYGDALFETIIMRNDKVYYLEDHLERLQKGMYTLKMRLSISDLIATISKNINDLISTNFSQRPEVIRIKVQVVRQSGGFYTPASNEADLYVFVQKTEKPQEIVKRQVQVSDTVRLNFSLYSLFKTCNSLPYILASLEKQEKNTDDLILLDNKSNIGELTAMNLFWIKDEILYTPSLQTGCLAGIMRKQIIKYANKSNIELKEGLYLLDALKSADFVFGTNVSGVYPIETIKNNENSYQYSTDLPWNLTSFYY